MYHFMKVDVLEQARNRTIKKLLEAHPGSMMQWRSKLTGRWNILNDLLMIHLNRMKGRPA